MKMFCSLLPNLVVMSHMWLLSSWNVISTIKRMHFLCYLILINFIVNSHMKPVATGSDSIDVEYKTVIHFKGLFWSFTRPFISFIFNRFCIYELSKISYKTQLLLPAPCHAFHFYNQLNISLLNINSTGPVSIQLTGLAWTRHTVHT